MLRACVATLSLCACGPGDGAEAGASTSTTDSSSGEGSSSSEGATSGDGTSSTSDASSSSTSSTGDTTGSHTGGTCEVYNDAYGDPLEVTILNNTNATRYIALADQCNQRVIDRLHEDGSPVPGNPDCWTCETMIAEGCECPPMPGPPCFVSAGLKLDPGASYVTTLGTTGFIAEGIPDSCVENPECPTGCSRAEPLAPGEYEIVMNVSDQVICDGGGCDCDTDQSGYCFIEVDGSLAGAPYQLRAPVLLPTATTTVSLD